MGCVLQTQQDRPEAAGGCVDDMYEGWVCQQSIDPSRGERNARAVNNHARVLDFFHQKSLSHVIFIDRTGR